MLWHGMRLTASLPVTPSLLMIVRILPNTFEPKSVIRVQSDFVLPACRLAVAFVEGVAGYVETFVEGVAGYVETKRQTRCRWQGESTWKA